MAEETIEAVREEPDVEEVECEECSQELELPEEERRLGDEEEGAQGIDAVPPEELDAIDEVADVDDDDAADEELGRAFRHGGAFLAPGGGWGGAEAPVRRAIRIGRRNGLTVTSTKRAKLSTGSDHHVSQKRAFAADLSNGSQPTPQMDRTARRIAAALGRKGWRGGVLTVTGHGIRAQLLWRTHVGGNHFNHVHFGCRRL